MRNRRNGPWQAGVKRREAGRPVLSAYLAVGTEDSLYGANQMFRRSLEDQKADFCYEEGPGSHNWSFWNQHINRGFCRILRP